MMKSRRHGYGEFSSMLHHRDAVRAAELRQVQTSIAIHFGTLEQGDDGQEEPVDSLAKALATRPTLTFLALKHGESRWILLTTDIARAGAIADHADPESRQRFLTA
jgi:hypothetical protein